MDSTIIEKKLQASLLSNIVQAEVLKYIRQLEKTSKELKERISDLSWQHDCAMGYVK